MGHVDNIKQLFGRFKGLNGVQLNLTAAISRLKTDIECFSKDNVQVGEAEAELIFLLGKSDSFAAEFEKLRVELNTYKNSPNPKPELTVKFNEKLSFIEEKQKDFGVKVEELKKKVAGFDGTIDKVKEPEYESEQTTEAESKENNDFGKQQYSQEKKAGKSSGHIDDAEVFIGQKIFSYVGIGVLLIGLGLGAKVAIENDWLGPIFQVVTGYSVAVTMGILGLWLKKKYEGFSAVLIGGGLATAYFMTYASYAYYGYFGQIESFSVMVVITAVTVYAALKYDKELIAILGMVGAYGIPFLLHDNSGRVHIMFTYMAIINAGILFLGFKKVWRGLYYSAFGLTWLIFGSWFLLEYEAAQHFKIAVVFMSIYYATFYAAFLAHKLIQKEKFNGGDISLILINSILFFLIGYNILDSQPIGQDYLGTFALANAAFHFLITLIFYKKNFADKGLFYVEAGLVLLFITIAIPIQFDGNWIPIFWTLEALILFVIGRIQGIKVYEYLSYPMIVFAFFSVCKSLVVDYQPYLNRYREGGDQLAFLSNDVFLGAALACLGFVVMSLLNRLPAKRPEKPNGWQLTLDYFLPITTFALIYFTFFAEISAHWTQQYAASVTESYHYNLDLLKFRTVSILDYSLIFLGGIGILNWMVWKNKNFGIILTSVSMFGVLMYAILGTVVFNDLCDSILGNNYWNEYFHLEASRVYLYKYASLLIFVLFTCVQFLSTRALKLGETFAQWNAALIHFCALIIISHEFLFIADTNGFSNSTKTALSVLWAAYAVVLLAIGISKERGYLRISAFVIWGIVLTKLLLYDLTHLSLEVKTIVFITIGVLLLIVSFLYYKVVAKQKQNSGSEGEAGHQESEQE